MGGRLFCLCGPSFAAASAAASASALGWTSVIDVFCAGFWSDAAVVESPVPRPRISTIAPATASTTRTTPMVSPDRPAGGAGGVGDAPRCLVEDFRPIRTFYRERAEGSCHLAIW